MNTQIRKIARTDNETLAGIIRRSFLDFNVPTAGTVFEDPTTDDLYTLFDRQGAVCYVAEAEDKIAGCGGLYPTEALPEGCAELVKLYIDASFRGVGLGKALVEKCLLSAKELGYNQIYLESMPGFWAAISMYERMGFEYLDQPMGNSGHSGCTIWMLKKI